MANYSGNVFSKSNTTQAIPVTGTIAADSSLKITGHASISSVCFNQFTLSGTQIGGAGQFVWHRPARRFHQLSVHLEGRCVRQHCWRVFRLPQVQVLAPEILELAR